MNQRRLAQLSLLFCLGCLSACCLDGQSRLVWSLECLNAGLTAGTRAGNGFGPPANLQVGLSDDTPAAAAAHRLACDIDSGSWQLLQAELHYPEGFLLDEQGFSTVGPLGSVVGWYQIDGDFDGSPESSYAVRSASDYFAYLDLDNDGVEDAFEPQLALSQDAAGAPRIFMLAPLGGDDLASRMLANRSFRALLELDAGPIRNPLQAGRYPIRARLESVDPDTGSANNGSGEEPLVLTLEVELPIGPALLVDGFEEVP